MAGRREFELLFRLQATLGGNFNSSFTSALNTTRQLQNSLAGINRVQRNIAGYQRQAQAVTNSRNRLAELTQEHERLQEEMNQTERPSESLRRRFESNTRQLERTNAQIERQQAQLDALGNELREAGVDTDNLAEENERLAETYEHVRRNQEQLGRIAEWQNQNNEAIARTRSQLGGTLGAVTAMGAAIYAGPVRNSIEFQASMAKVGTIADESVVPLATMQREILKLSNTVGVSANLIAEDVYNAISAGQSTEDAVSFVERAVKLAGGGFADTGQALDVLTTIINAYGLESADAAKISDMLIQTQNKGKVTVAELSANMGKIIPTANSNNVALEQLCAGYAIMTSKGIAAAETTTYMNSMFNELGKTGSKADAALKQMAGAGFKDLMAQGKSVAEVLAMLEQSAQQNGLNLADMFGSAEAGKAALTLMADGVDGFNESVAGMLDSSGAAEAAFAKMADTTQNKLDKAKTAIGNLSIVLGDTFLPYVTSGAEKLTELVSKISDWAMANPELLNTIVKVAGGLTAVRVGTLGAKLGFLQLKGMVLDVMAALASFRALGGIQGILGMAGGGLGTLLGGIGRSLLPITAIAAAVAVASKLISGNLAEVRAFIEHTFGGGALALFDKVVAVLQNVGRAIKSVFGAENINSARAFLQNIFGNAGTAVFDALIDVIEKLKAVLPTFIEQLANGVAAVLPVVIELFNQLAAVIGFVAENIFPIVIQAAGQVISLFMNMINAVLPVLVQLLQSLAPVIQSVAALFGNVLGAVLQSVTTIIGSVMQAFQGLIDFITGAFSGNWARAWEGIKNIFAGIAGSLAGIFKAPLNIIISGINTFLSGLNKVKIPDWVPGVGGKGFNISLLPMLAKGSNYAPDTFIAGEAGAELITGAKGKKVFTAAQTGKIFRNLETAQNLLNQQVLVSVAPVLQPTLAAAETAPLAGGLARGYTDNPVNAVSLLEMLPEHEYFNGVDGGNNFSINVAPVYNISAVSSPEEIKEVLRQHDENLPERIRAEIADMQTERKRRSFVQ